MNNSRFNDLINGLANLIQQEIRNHDDQELLHKHIECLSELIKLQADFGFDDD